MAGGNGALRPVRRERTQAKSESAQGSGGLIFSTLDDAVTSIERLLKMRVTRRDVYHDRDGAEYFVVVRFDGAGKKEFRPFFRSGSGWAVKDPPGKPPLFRLPDLIARPGGRVFIVEGEKCACELETLKILVTTSAHGAKSADKTDWQPLAGREVVILPDNDKGGREYAQTVAGILSRLSPPAQICIVELPGLPPKGDCVDWLDARDARTPEEIRAELFGLVKSAAIQVEGVGRDAKPKRAPLTIRTIAEILDMTFDDDSQMILANGYLTNGERTAVCGMGGVGKTRLIMQLALCCRAGRNFLAWPTHRRESVFLFLQTENSCRRLKFDLERMLTGFTPEECDRIKNGIFFHTLEQDEDGFLMLDLENSQRIANAIAQTGANVVVFDPLRDFGSDDLNSDRYMAETLREISRVTKRGNPNRALLVIHHAGTGKAGIQKTLGFDRSSFGRNSKVLFSWARAQINVAPALPDDNSLIIIASGKCSNAPEFEPFAARLNPETMLYEIDEGFDMEGWRQDLGSSTGKARLKPNILRDLLQKGREYEKKQIVAIIIEDKGIGKARAYEIVDEAYIRKILRYNRTIKTYELA